MSPRRFSRREMRKDCAEVGPDDGIDPREFFRKDGPRPKGRKAMQLCGQVEQALTWVLAAECRDEVLQGLAVVSVRPAPNTARLLVTVAPGPAAEGVDPAVILAHLQRAYGLLRSEVAAAINRRRTPELAFRVVSR